MIPGFEEETAPMSTEEISLAHVFVKGFSGHVGEDNVITSDQIIFRIKALGYSGMNGARVRKIINYIRVRKLVKNLVATSKGYYIENNPEKVKIYQSGLKARAAAIMAVANSYNP